MLQAILVGVAMAGVTLLSACKGEGESSRLETAAAAATLYVALPAQSQADAPLSLDIAAPSQASGVVLCRGNLLEQCRRGLGEILTANLHRTLASGLAVFRTNLSIKPAPGQELTVVAFDSQGVVLGANVVRMEAR